MGLRPRSFLTGNILCPIFGTVSLQCDKTPAHITYVPSSRAWDNEERKNYKMGQKVWGSEPLPMQISMYVNM